MDRAMTDKQLIFVTAAIVVWLSRTSAADISAVQFTGTHNALVIGVGDFKDLSLLRLRGPRVDSGRMVEALTNAKNGLVKLENLIVLNDAKATKAEVLKSLGDLKSRMHKEDTLIVYFSGHSYHDELDGTLFLAMYDSTFQDKHMEGLSIENELYQMVMSLTAILS